MTTVLTSHSIDWFGLLGCSCFYLTFAKRRVCEPQPLHVLFLRTDLCNPVSSDWSFNALLCGKSQSKEPERPLPPLGPVAVDPKGCVTIAIHAKPGSKQNAVTDVTAEAVSVAIAAPPSEGEANAELCRYLSKVLELRKSDVVLDKGGKSREKVVKLLASTTAEEILEKLKQQVEKK
uniref:Chromosome 15 open reading frame 40 n=1 Tax=Ursus maritimus TaxID=29073 RepID=A0A452TZI6_URSMA